MIHSIAVCDLGAGIERDPVGKFNKRKSHQKPFRHYGFDRNSRPKQGHCKRNRKGH